MEIIPKSVEYHFVVGDHKMMSIISHLKDGRRVEFFFDGKLISQKIVPPDDYIKDDDCISELVENYCNNTKGVYSDLIKNHCNKIQLSMKSSELSINNNGIVINAIIISRKNTYNVDISTDNGNDSLKCTFEAGSFSEVLEKLRLLMFTLDGVSVELVNNIDELSDDKIQKWINWKE